MGERAVGERAVGERLLVRTCCEDLPTYASSSLAYHAHVTVGSDMCHDKVVNQQFAVFSGSSSSH